MKTFGPISSTTTTSILLSVLLFTTAWNVSEGRHCPPTISPAPTITPRPTDQPSAEPTVSQNPSEIPSATPTESVAPSETPTDHPSSTPSLRPSVSQNPSEMPSATPTQSVAPSEAPTDHPSSTPSLRPSVSFVPTASMIPSVGPTDLPSMPPSNSPSAAPSSGPTDLPSSQPTLSVQPSEPPSNLPSVVPSATPSMSPSASPSINPTTSPSKQPSTAPSMSPQPSQGPTKSAAPSGAPSMSHQPTYKNPPTSTPTAAPTAGPKTYENIEITVNIGTMSEKLEGYDLDRFRQHAQEFLQNNFKGPDQLVSFNIDLLLVLGQEFVNATTTDGTEGDDEGANGRLRRNRFLAENELLVTMIIDATFFPGDILYDFQKAYEIAFEDNMDDFQNNLYVLGLQDAQAPTTKTQNEKQTTKEQAAASFPLVAVGAVIGVLLSIAGSAGFVFYRRGSSSDDSMIAKHGSGSGSDSSSNGSRASNNDRSNAMSIFRDQKDIKTITNTGSGSSSRRKHDDRDIENQPSVVSLSGSEDSDYLHDTRRQHGSHESGAQPLYAAKSNLRLNTTDVPNDRRKNFVRFESNIDIPETPSQSEFSDVEEPETPHEERVANFLNPHLTKIVGSWTETISKEITGAWNRKATANSFDGAQMKMDKANRNAQPTPGHEDGDAMMTGAHGGKAAGTGANCAATFPSAIAGNDMKKQQEQYFRKFANNRQQVTRNMAIPFIIQNSSSNDESVSDLMCSPLSQGAIMESELQVRGASEKNRILGASNDEGDDDDAASNLNTFLQQYGKPQQHQPLPTKIMPKTFGDVPTSIPSIEHAQLARHRIERHSLDYFSDSSGGSVIDA